MMHNNESNYQFWTWIVALILSVILLLMLFTGHGPNASCCAESNSSSASSEVLTDTAIVGDTSEFGFSATATDFSHTGNSANVSWFNQADRLKSILAGGTDLQADGDDKRVKLSGTVETNALKTSIGADAQQFFGGSVLIDNQIVVKAAEASAPAAPAPVATAPETPASQPVAAVTEVAPVVANASPPPAAKLYFRTASSTLPSNTKESLAPILEWLKSHPEAKAIISGFHDAVGNPVQNVELAKKRALATLDALKAAGVDESRIIPRPPMSTDGGTDLAEARRVEVSIE
jgi:outer membrane protein OmpA-like peptidoglycan-associated protein